MEEADLTLEDLEMVGLEPPRPKPKTQWTLEAAVLPVRQVICACGSTSSRAEGEVLARFRHKKDKTRTWEIAHHPSHFNPQLPRETKELDPVFLNACPDCWAESTGQLPLFQEAPEVH